MLAFGMMNHPTEFNTMPSVKVAITVDRDSLKELDRMVAEGQFPNRSRGFQAALDEKLARSRRTRLAAECAHLEPAEERALADEVLAGESGQWPRY